MDKIRIGIVGYGNLARGVEKALKLNPDMELVAVFTRRDPTSLKIADKSADTVHISDIEGYKDRIDIMILCGGSARDLPEQGPSVARFFNTVDSYDNHDMIPEYLEIMSGVARSASKLSMISSGWDPGLFSLNRLLVESVLSKGETYTFWGKGVSQGHSDALRQISGVLDAVQYTIPMEEAVDRVRKGENPDLSPGERHERHCYLVTEEGANQEEIERKIKTMPNYFEGYKTVVNFISLKELKEEHFGMPHGGRVIRSGFTDSENDHHQTIEFGLKLDNNPEFTASVLVAYSRAVYRLHKEGRTGAITIFDIPLKYLSPRPESDIIKDLL